MVGTAEQEEELVMMEKDTGRKMLRVSARGWRQSWEEELTRKEFQATRQGPAVRK